MVKSTAGDERNRTAQNASGLHCQYATTTLWNEHYDDASSAAAFQHTEQTIGLLHNLPPHLSYVSTLPDITQKRKFMLSSSQ